ncbi:MAG: hypothetical protein R3360_06735 [Alphaproteobacteria bacterium]|nr:hypothetical protein [Alphaproteobacteria bacterium]
MIRCLVACLSAASFLVATSAPAMAEGWRADSWRFGYGAGYSGTGGALSGVLDESESAGMAYLTIPFGGQGVKKSEPRFGFTIATRLPDGWSSARVGGRAGVAEVFNISWTPSGTSDWRLSGISFNDFERRMNAVDQEVSGFWTYGLMLAAAGAAAAVVLLADGDAETFPPEEDPMDGGDGTGDGMGDGTGDGTGDGGTGM